ncbi:hypothetical protein, partial [Enterobacter hormaechei]|uniref:hypothetical protein n=1 Tax=Enterobacter hormaechei TaxID=158836 RepID=UPI00197AE18B
MGQRIPVTLGNIAPLAVKPFRPGKLALVCEGSPEDRLSRFKRRANCVTLSGEDQSNRKAGWGNA